MDLFLERDILDIVILGALGARWDMTFSNVLILAAPLLKRARVRILADYQEIFCLHGGQEADIDGEPGDDVSLLPLGHDAVGVSLDGFEYPLQGETLAFGTTRGVSNVLTVSPGRVRVERGHLLLVITHRGR